MYVCMCICRKGSCLITKQPFPEKSTPKSKLEKEVPVSNLC